MADNEPEVTQELEQQGSALVKTIPLIAIVDDDSFQAAVRERAEIRRRLVKISELMDPIVKSAHETWRTATGRREQLRAPFVQADDAYSRAMGSYEREQKRLRDEEAQRAAREREQLEAEERERARAETERLRKLAEDERLAAAARAEQQGDHERAERLLDAPIDTPAVQPRAIYLPQPPVAPAPVAAGVSFRDVWSAEIVDLLALVRAVASGSQPLSLVSANMPALHQLARALKSTLAIPGVRAKSERIAPQRTPR